MNAVILNGMHSGQESLIRLQRAIESFFHQHQISVRSHVLHQYQIPFCCGHFFCWVKTPGECTLKGFVSEIGRDLIHSDIAVYLSPVTFGGVSSVFKRALDHQLALLTPMLKGITIETHHRPRYDFFPRIAAVGYLQQPNVSQERLFRQYIETHAHQLHASGYSADFFYDNESDEMIHVKLSLLFARTGAEL